MAIDDIQEKFDDSTDETETVVEETQPVADFKSEAKAEEPESKQEEPEQKSEAEPEEKKPEDVKMVPYAALHEERQNRKELQAEMGNMREQMGQFKGLAEEMKEMRGSRAAEQEKTDEAAFSDDPIEALRQQNLNQQAQIDGQNAAKTAEEEQQAQLNQQQQDFQAMMQNVSSKVAEFEGENADYPEAFKYLMDSKLNEYKAIGITDPMELQQTFDREAIALSVNAINRGVNPGESVYNLAKSRGYTKAEALSDVEDPIAKENLDKTMDRLEAGTKAASTLSGGTGGKVEGDLTLADIDKMGDDEFDKLFDKMSGGSIYSNG